MQKELREAEFNSVIKTVDSLLNEQLKHPIERKEYACEFLEKVRKGLLLNTETSLTKSIISYAYSDAPHHEIIR